MGVKVKKEKNKTHVMLNLFQHRSQSGLTKRINTLIFSILILFIFCTGVKTFAQNSAQDFSDSQKYVRVAISNTNFKSTVYQEVSIFATSEYAVYDKETSRQIIKLQPSDILKIKQKTSGFELSVNGKVEVKDLNAILIVDCPKGLIGVENLKRNGKQALYHGVFELTLKNDSGFFVINVLDLQSYLKGVVPNEMPTRFGLEALKAQAVAARNYVLMPRTRAFKEFDVDDSVASQVYFGANTETELSNRAVNETDGLVALYNWDLILAQYSSTAGGYTESYENTFSEPKTRSFPSKSKPYLQGKPDILSVAPLNREEEARLFYMSFPDSYDMKSPYYRWQKEWEAKELRDVLAKTLFEQSKTGFIRPEYKSGEVLGEIKELKVNQRGVSGKIMELEIVTENQNYKVQKELVIRRLLQKNGISLPSANVVFENQYNTDKKLTKVIAYGGGFGHGVGMSQYGAGFMATSLHKSFDKILKRYYSGISISTVPMILSSAEGQRILSQKFYAPDKKAVLIVDNKYNITSFDANINGKDVCIELSNKIVPFNRISRVDISSYIKQGLNTITFNFPLDCENKALRLYVELVEKDENEYNF